MLYILLYYNSKENISSFLRTNLEMTWCPTLNIWRDGMRFESSTLRVESTKREHKQECGKCNLVRYFGCRSSWCEVVLRKGVLCTENLSKL